MLLYGDHRLRAFGRCRDADVDVLQKACHSPEPAISRFTSFPGVETMPAFCRTVSRLFTRAPSTILSACTTGEGKLGQANIYTRLIEAGTELRLTRHPGADVLPNLVARRAIYSFLPG